MQKIANLVLKTDKIGSTVQRWNVTPAEVMFLVADHQQNAGGDPIVKLTEIPDSREAKLLVPLKDQLKELEVKLEETYEEELTEEIRNRRVNAILTKTKAVQDQIAQYEGLVRLRELTPAQERIRLVGRYGAPRIKKFFPGAIPSLPTSFEEAKTSGLGGAIETERMIDNSHMVLVGDTAVAA
jgi:hypothetical protein